MKNPFDKSFFGFSLGLALILVISFVIIYAAGSHKVTQTADVSDSQPCVPGQNNVDC
jgi:hypothetical protein